jgi:hypothetical protein
LSTGCAFHHSSQSERRVLIGALGELTLHKRRQMSAVRSDLQSRATRANPHTKGLRMLIHEMTVEQDTSPAELANWVDVKGPCVSIYLPFFAPKQKPVPFQVRLRSALGVAERQLRASAVFWNGIDQAFEDLYMSSSKHAWEMDRGGLAIFIAPGFTRFIRLSNSFSELVKIGSEFYVWPLLSVLSRRRPFYVLGLSQKHVRLLKFTDGVIAPVPLPASTPANVEEAGAFDQPDHDLENRSAAGGESAERRRIHFGTGSGEEKSEAYLAHFFRLVDQAVTKTIAAERLPLVLIAVDREIHLYCRISKYQQLSAAVVHSSPEGLTDSETCSRALQSMEAQRSVDEEIFIEQIGADRRKLLSDLTAILEAGRHGRIRELVLQERQTGTVQDELINFIAIDTLRHRGTVTILAHHAVPYGAPCLALLRYQAEPSAQASS